MPVYLDSRLPGHDLPAGPCIRIGLMNNMPDGALQATERQFTALLGSAAGDASIRLSLFAFPDLPRTDAGLRHIRRSYFGLEELFDSHLDGLIVTGAEPRALNLRDEPYWKSLTNVLDWARNNTRSTVWSCLAAHAAVLHMDGIRRHKSDDKHFGILECARVSNHRLTAGVSLRFGQPHSRWNGLPEDDLMACRYTILTRTLDSGVDMFVKEQKSLFVFFQGHPEYESDTLWLEYRREIGRYVRRETDTYPSIPRSYLDPETAQALTALREGWVSGQHKELLAQVSTIAEKRRIANTWGSSATCIYRNWLEFIRGQMDAFEADSSPISTASSAVPTLMETVSAAPEPMPSGNSHSRLPRP